MFADVLLRVLKKINRDGISLVETKRFFMTLNFSARRTFNSVNVPKILNSFVQTRSNVSPWSGSVTRSWTAVMAVMSALCCMRWRLTSTLRMTSSPTPSWLLWELYTLRTIYTLTIGNKNWLVYELLQHHFPAIPCKRSLLLQRKRTKRWNPSLAPSKT